MDIPENESLLVDYKKITDPVSIGDYDTVSVNHLEKSLHLNYALRFGVLYLSRYDYENFYKP